MKILMFVACLLGLSGMPTNHLAAQTTGTVEGTVSDGTGAPMPSQRVELNQPDTGQNWTAVTDSNGHYQFNGVEPGHYRVMLIAPPGTTAARTPAAELDVAAGPPAMANLSWNMGGQNTRPPAGTPRTDTITNVTTNPLQTDNAQIEHVWNTTMVTNTPEANLINKNGKATSAYNLSLSSEAVTTSPSVARGPSVGGQPPISNNFRMDGADNNNKVEPGPLVYLPNTAWMNTTLFENQATPVFGHSMGGDFGGASRSGTNAFHGQLYDYLQNTHLDAIDQSWSRLGMTSRPRYDQNRLGAALGFPILPSKIFFFGNFEYIPLGFRSPTGGGIYAPTAAGFAQLSALRGVSSSNLGILRTATAGTVGPATQTTTVLGLTIPLGLVNTTQRGWQNQYVGDGGLDFALGTHDSLSLRYAENRIDDSFAGPALSLFDTPSGTTALAANASESHTFSPSLTNQFRLAYNRWDRRIEGNPLNAFPQIAIGGISNLLLGPATTALASTWNTYQGNDTVGWDFHGNSVKVGADVMRYISSIRGMPAFNGTFAYSGLQGYLLDQTPDLLAQRAFGSDFLSDNRTLVTGFIQDTWQMRQNVTVNLGVRYFYDTLPETMTRQGLLNSASVPGRLSFTTPSTQTTNFAPNVGFAYAPGSGRKMVFRAGFGMAYDALYNPYMLNGALFSPALGNTLVTASAGTPAVGFFSGGAIPGPVRGSFTSLTPAAQRPLISTYIGPQKLPYSMQWNAGFQGSPWRNGTVEIKYLGAKDTHLSRLAYVNQVSPVTASRSLPVFFQQPTSAQIGALTTTLSSLEAATVNPLASAGFTNPILTIAPDSNAFYNAGMVTFNQRLGALSVIGNYTLSHLIDEATGTPLDLAFGRERANSLYDHRHRVSTSGVLDLAPLFSNTFSVLRNVVANLSIAGTYIYQSPQYLPALSNVDMGLTANGIGSPAVFNPRGTAGVTSGVTPVLNASGQTVAYVATNPNARFVQGAPGVFASGIRNAFKLDPVDNVDLSVTKRFTYRDRWGFELRGDAYNAFNHAQFTGVPINSFEINQAGLFANNLALVSGLMTAGGPGFGAASEFLPSNARVLQLALRMTF